MVRQKYGAAERRGKRAKGCFARFHWKERNAKESRRAGRAARGGGGSLRGAEPCGGNLPPKRTAPPKKEPPPGRGAQREPKGGNFYPIFKKL